MLCISEPSRIPRRNYIQQDGAPPRFTVLLCQYLVRSAPTVELWKAGPIPWRPHSPYSMPCDYILCGFLEDFVFCEPPNTTSELNTAKAQAVASIDEVNYGKCLQKHANLLVLF